MTTIDLSAPDNRYFSGYQDTDGKVYGPRLVETEVAFATYGVTIPQVCGTTRLRGNIIWADELQETFEYRNYIYYSRYNATFAVSFGYNVNTDKATTDILRIWLDGDLVYDGRTGSRGIASGFKFTWYDGSENQFPDPTIAAVEGDAFTPAFRGQMYVVIRDLDVTPYENKVPFVSIEIGDIGTITNNFESVTVTNDNNNVNVWAVDWQRERAWVVNTAGTPNTIRAYDISSPASLISEFTPNSNGEEGTVTGAPAQTSQPIHYIPWLDVIVGNPDVVELTPPLYAWSPVSGGIQYVIDENSRQFFNIYANYCETIYGIYTYIFCEDSLDNLHMYEISPAGIITRLDNTNFNIYSGGGSYGGSICPGPRTSTSCSFYFDEGDSVHIITAYPHLVAEGSPDAAQVTQDVYPYDGVGTPVVRGLQYDVPNQFLYIWYDSEARKIDTRDGSNVWRVDSTSGYPSYKYFALNEISGDKIGFVRSDGDIIEWDLVKGVETVYSGPGVGVIDTNGVVSANRGYAVGLGLVTNRLSKTFYRSTTDDELTLGDVIKYYAVKAGYSPSDITIDASVTETVVGFLIDETQTLNDIIEPIKALFGVEIVESGSSIVVKSRSTSFGAPDFTITEDELVPTSQAGDSFLMAREEEDYMPNQVSFTYIDASLNYEWTTQTVSRPRNTTLSVNSSDNAKNWKLPVVLSPTQAKYAAYRALMNPWLSRKSYKFMLPREYMNIEPGDVVDITFNGIQHLVQVVTATISKRTFQIEITATDFQEYEDFTVTSFPGTAYNKVIVSAEQFQAVPMFFETLGEIWEGDNTNTSLSRYNPPQPYMYCLAVPRGQGSTFDVDVGLAYSVGFDPNSGPNQSFIPIQGYTHDFPVPWGKLTKAAYRPGTTSGLDDVESITLEVVGGDASLFTSTTQGSMLGGENRIAIMTWDAVEILGFTTVTDNLDGTITLSGLYRGLARTDYFVKAGPRWNGTDGPELPNAYIPPTAQARRISSNYYTYANSRLRNPLNEGDLLWPAGATVVLLNQLWTTQIKLPFSTSVGQEINFKATTRFIRLEDANVYSKPLFGWSISPPRAMELQIGRGFDSNCRISFSRETVNYNEWTTDGTGVFPEDTPTHPALYQVLFYRADDNYWPVDLEANTYIWPMSVFTVGKTNSLSLLPSGWTTTADGYRYALTGSWRWPSWGLYNRFQYGFFGRGYRYAEYSRTITWTGSPPSGTVTFGTTLYQTFNEDVQERYPSCKIKVGGASFGDDLTIITNPRPVAPCYYIGDMNASFSYSQWTTTQENEGKMGGSNNWDRVAVRRWSNLFLYVKDPTGIKRGTITYSNSAGSIELGYDLNYRCPIWGEIQEIDEDFAGNEAVTQWLEDNADSEYGLRYSPAIIERLPVYETAYSA